MNKVVIVGRLTRDPELRYTLSNTPVVSFTLAVDRRFRSKAIENNQPTADFIPVVAWSKLAEIIAHNLVKGRRIGIEGRLQSRNYETKEGIRRTAYEVVADDMEFLDARTPYANGDYQGGNSYDANDGSYSKSAEQHDMMQADTFGAPPLNDEEIPF